MQSIIIFQIVADVALCIAVLLLLLRIGRNINSSRQQAIDPISLAQFQKLLGDAQNDTTHFFRMLEDSLVKFQDLALRLEKKEESLKKVMEGFHEQFGQNADVATVSATQSIEQRREWIVRHLSDGLSAGEIAQRLGMAEGEVALIVNLERKKKELTNPNSEYNP